MHYVCMYSAGFKNRDTKIYQTHDIIKLKQLKNFNKITRKIAIYNKINI